MLTFCSSGRSLSQPNLFLFVSQGVVTPNVKDDALPLAKLGRKCGAGVANCMHGCCSQLGVCGHSGEEGWRLFLCFCSGFEGRERRER